uniref:GRF-type domain-containing protein n=1 Tax=Solanum tuberosum TaxID=4113 RepID=M1B3Y3_SOLTU
MSQSSVNIEEVDICKCGYYCQLKTSRTPLNPGHRFFGCKASKENGGCGYFRWIDPSLENADESFLMNRFIDGQNLIDRLKRKVKKLEEERDSLKFQLNENEEKMMVCLAFFLGFEGSIDEFVVSGHIIILGIGCMKWM